MTVARKTFKCIKKVLLLLDFTSSKSFLMTMSFFLVLLQRMFNINVALFSFHHDSSKEVCQISDHNFVSSREK